MAFGVPYSRQTYCGQYCFIILLLTEMLGIKGVRQLYIQGPQGPDGFPIRDAAIQLLTTRPSGR